MEKQKVKQIMAIAKFCGWTDIEIEDYTDHGVPSNILVGKLNGVKSAIPNYFNDLNAIHEVEKKLNTEQQLWIKAWLSNVWVPTASQKVELIIRALNLK